MSPWATLIPPVALEEGRRGAGDRGRDPWAPGSSGRKRQPLALVLPIPSGPRLPGGACPGPGTRALGERLSDAAGRQALRGASLRRALQVRRYGLGAKYSQR